MNHLRLKCRECGEWFSAESRQNPCPDCGGTAESIAETCARIAFESREMRRDLQLANEAARLRQEVRATLRTSEFQKQAGALEEALRDLCKPVPEEIWELHVGPQPIPKRIMDLRIG